VDVGLGVELAVALGVAVAVAVAVAVGVGDGVGPQAEGVPVAVGVGLGDGVGEGVPTAAAISIRPQPKTLFGGPAVPHCVEEIKTAELFKASRLAVIWCLRLGMAHHSNPIAPEICGVAMDVPLAVVYALSLLLLAERVPVPGAVISGFIRLLPSAVTGPRLLNPAIVSVPVFRAPTV
jgi:hypothetical protein